MRHSGEGSFILNGQKIVVGYELQEIRRPGHLPEVVGRFTSFKNSVTMRKIFFEAGRQKLTLTLGDGSTVDFYAGDSNGKIVPTGPISPPEKREPEK